MLLLSSTFTSTYPPPILPLCFRLESQACVTTLQFDRSVKSGTWHYTFSVIDSLHLFFQEAWWWGFLTKRQLIDHRTAWNNYVTAANLQGRTFTGMKSASKITIFAAESCLARLLCNLTQQHMAFGNNLPRSVEFWLDSLTSRAFCAVFGPTLQ